MNQSISSKLGLNADTLKIILDDMASSMPSLRGRPAEALESLLNEVLGVLTGDSPRSEFPRTETDREVYRVARARLEPDQPNELTCRLAWGSLWFGRPLTAAA